MADYLTEQEQVELLKSWIKQYGLVVLSGIILAIIIITGMRFWRERQLNLALQASHIYDVMLTSRAQNNTEATLTQADKLLTNYKNTAYASMAALMAARTAILKNDFATAEKQFRWVMSHSDSSATSEIARLRLARLLIASQRAKESLTILNKIDDNAFAGLSDEIKGDAYLALHDIAQAKNAYHTALSEIPHADVVRPLLQIKYDNVSNSSP